MFIPLRPAATSPTLWEDWLTQYNPTTPTTGCKQKIAGASDEKIEQALFSSLGLHYLSRRQAASHKTN